LKVSVITFEIRIKTQADSFRLVPHRLQWREHEWKCVLLLKTFPFMYMYPLLDVGRMERQKHDVAK